MNDANHPLERLARWQASRRQLSWAEKVAMAEAVRESLVSLAALRAAYRPARTSAMAEGSMEEQSPEPGKAPASSDGTGSQP